MHHNIIVMYIAIAIYASLYDHDYEEFWLI